MLTLMGAPTVPKATGVKANSAPFEASFKLDPGQLIIKTKNKNGERLSVQFATDQDESSTNRKDLAGNITFTSADTTLLGPFKLAKGDQVGPDIVLGMDVLSKLVIGVQLYAGKMTIWRHADFSLDTAQEWFKNIGVSAEAPSIASIGLTSSGLPTLPLTGEGRTITTLLTIGWKATQLMSLPGHEKDPPNVARMVANGKVGNLAPRWMVVANGPPEMVSAFKDLDVQGCFSLDNFQSPAMLIDFASHRILLPSRSANDANSSFLSLLTGIPWRFEDIKITIGGSDLQYFPNYQPDDGWVLKSLAGEDSGVLRRHLENPSSDSAQWLTDLVSKLIAPANYTFTAPDGSEKMMPIVNGI